MSERSRGPEGSSGPAPTDRGKASGSEDFYAAAAATVAARNGNSNGRTTQDRGRPTPDTRPAQRSAESAPASKESASRNSTGRESTAAESAGRRADTKPAARAADSGESENETTAIGAIASQVLSAVRPKSKAEKAEQRAQNSGPAADLVRSQPAPETRQQPVQGPAVAAAAAAAARGDKPRAGVARGTRKARLRLSRLDPWSVMKTAFMFSIAAGIVFVVAVFAVWTVIGSSGLFASVDSIVGSVLQSPGDTTPFRIEDYVNTQKVMGVTAFLACIDVVIFTALATLASFLYNLAATMLGGLEVTLAED